MGNARLAKLELIGNSPEVQKGLCDALAASAMFNRLRWPEIERLAKYLQVYRAPADTLLFREGDQGDFMCLTLRGSVEIDKEDHDQHNKAVATISAGRTFGEMAVIDGEPRSASCLTRMDTELAILTRSDLDRLILEHPALGAKVLHCVARLLSQRLRMASGQLVDYLDN